MGKEMYMKFKNMMTAGTCLVLSAALLAGCGASASETSSESASSEAVAPEETASPEVAEDSYYPVSADTTPFRLTARLGPLSPQSTQQNLSAWWRTTRAPPIC